MKIKIDTKTDTIVALHKITDIVHFDKSWNRQQKCVGSILLDVQDKIASKTKIILRECIENNRKTSLTLKYHEAETLERYARSMASKNILNGYASSLLNTLADQLNQKLA